MFTPENELGVIVVFAQEAHHYGFNIKTISANFPDAIIEKDGQSYRAEFEFMASSFDAHGHDHRECDLIICWQNDYDNGVLPILALSEDDWMHTDLHLPTDSARAACYWKRRALKAERSFQLLKSQTEKVVAVDNGPFICEICAKMFRSQAALNGHQNAHRAGETERSEP